MSRLKGPGLMFAAAASGFVAGSANPATALARFKGVDIREVGSGNPGATNTARALGARAGVIVGVLDVLKGLVPSAGFSRLDPVAGEVAGLTAVLGHIYSPFLRGKGGKGVATTLGAVLGVEPLWSVPMLTVFGVTFAATKRVGIGAVAGSATLVGIGIWGADRADKRAFAITLGAVVMARHHGNIASLVRAWRGESGLPDISVG